MKIYKLIFVLLIIFSLVSCEGKQKNIEAVCEDSCPVLMSENMVVPVLNKSRASYSDNGRKVSYSAECGISVSKSSSAVSNAEKITLKSGGLVLSEGADFISVLVPADSFNKALEKFFELGKVLYKNISLNDISDSFYDVQTRVNVLEKTKLRLQKLLENCAVSGEQIKIIREINRISDELNSIYEKMKELERKSDFASVYLTFENIAADDIDEFVFPWIKALKADEITVDRLYGRIGFSVPANFGVLKKMRSFMAVSTFGTAVRIGTVRNYPKGDNKFWQLALEREFSVYFENVKLVEDGILKGILVSVENGYYLVEVSANKGNLLYVTEVFFPDEKSFANDMENMKKALGEFKIR